MGELLEVGLIIDLNFADLQQSVEAIRNQQATMYLITQKLPELCFKSIVPPFVSFTVRQKGRV